MASIITPCVDAINYFCGEEFPARVFIDKYALRNEGNNLIEHSPIQLHKRLAKELARVEKQKFRNPLSFDTIYRLLKDFKYIIPQGSPMYGIGNPAYITLSNCIHGESLVYTKELGLVKMKDIKPGLHVLTHNKRFRRVVKHWSNGYKNTSVIARSFSDKRIHVNDEQEMSRFLGVTPEHQVYTKDNKWIQVQNIKDKKSLAIPTINYEGEIPNIFPVGMGRHVLLNTDFMWILGMYLAEGAIHKNNSNHPNTYFTLNSNETAYAKRISDFSEQIFGNKAWIQTWDNYNFIQVNIFEPELAILLDKLCGHGFANKRVPQWVFGINNELQTALIDGFLSGDGTNYESLEDDYNFFSIANPTMAYELGLLCRNINKNVRFNFLTKGKLIKHRSVAVTISNQEDKIQIISKSPVEVEVFDMEVEEDNSFVAGDVICHNCYVIQPPIDSYNGIHYTDEQITQISKRRGGVGTDMSALRPIGMVTHNSSRTTTGIVPFAQRFSNSIREVGQDGRRGALMLSLSVHHPEIINFAGCKLDTTKVTGANISIRLTDEFLNAVARNEDYEQRWPVDSATPTISKMVNARSVWETIINYAWQSAEPGLLFWDRILKESPADCYAEFGFRTVATNPCSELPLPVLDSCRLLLLNLFSFVANPFTSAAIFLIDKFKKFAGVAQRLMDDIIDLELECVDRIIGKVKSDPEPAWIKDRELSMWQHVHRQCSAGRRTGTGLTAVGDTVAALGMKYGSQDSIKFIEFVYREFKLACYASSVRMAKELGPFPIFNADLEEGHAFLDRIKEDDPKLFEEMRRYGRRNIALLTQAPAGSVSALCGPRPYFGTTSGIEPLFKMSYVQNKKVNFSDYSRETDFVDANGDHWKEFTIIHPKVRQWMDVTGEKDLRKSPYYGSCAEEIDWSNRVVLQGRANLHIDHSISSTINLPEDVSQEEVSKIYMDLWKNNCKGGTVYRANCRTGCMIEHKETCPNCQGKNIISKQGKCVSCIDCGWSACNV